MGFKIGKSKSWKKLGKKNYWDKTAKSAGKDQETFWKDSDGSKTKFFEGFGKESNYKNGVDSIGKGLKPLGKAETWGAAAENAGDGMKKTWNAASKGLGDSLGGMGDAMSNALLAGGVLVAGFLVLSLIPEKRKTIEE